MFNFFISVFKSQPKLKLIFCLLKFTTTNADTKRWSVSMTDRV
jgi:hypothetical protein